jgi:NitT/TauT family transport system ATP-binding protein
VSAAAIELRGVAKQFRNRSGQTTALQDVDLIVSPGEMVVLVGPSGCGKSTLLNIVAGLETADSGAAMQNGKPITGPGRERSVVFQDGALFPWLSARSNVEFGLKQRGISATERRARAEEMLKLVHLARFADSRLHELSGGMRQRVALARALALEPEALLMDEPFAALDAQTKLGIYAVLQEIWQRTGQTILFVTHDVREAVVLADRVVVMSARPGRIKSVVPVQLARPRHPEDVDVARTAQTVLHLLKEDVTRELEEEYDRDWHPEDAGLPRAADSLLGDHI